MNLPNTDFTFGNKIKQKYGEQILHNYGQHIR